MATQSTHAKPARPIVREAFITASPIMVGYLFLGIPCGILCHQVGMDVLQVALMCAVFYSGAGQYMIPNMWLTGAPISAIIASVSLVNTRQILYGASLSRFCDSTRRSLAVLFGATVTDESFAVNLVKLEQGGWPIKGATLVNIFSQSSWLVANVIGVLVGALLSVPTALASFAMTSIFLCLLFSQKKTHANIAAGLAAALGVVLCKTIGLTGPAILIGAVIGILAGIAVSRKEGMPAPEAEPGKAEDAAGQAQGAAGGDASISNETVGASDEVDEAVQEAAEQAEEIAEAERRL